MQPLSHVVWNLFLAVISVGLGVVIYRLWTNRPELRKNSLLWIGLGVLWLGFLPNACYLMTEWRHFLDYVTSHPAEVRGAEHDRDKLISFLTLSTFYVIYSGTGVIAFAASIWPVDRIVRPNSLIKVVFFFSCALGVYLGLIKRYNTWDVVRHPARIIASSLETLTHPVLLALTIGFALILWFSYWLFAVFADGLVARKKAYKSKTAHS